MTSPQEIATVLGRKELKISREKIDKLDLFMRDLLSANQDFNLLGRGEEKNFLERHLLDSLVALPLLSQLDGPLMDLGSGGGLPGIPLAICSPKRPFFLVESREKKAEFLRNSVRDLQLKEVFVINARAEDLAKEAEFREKMGLLTARGLAFLPALLELTLPFIRIGGFLLAWKGPALDEELDKSREALNLLGGIIDKRFSHTISGKEHFLQLVKKTEKTPSRFPRRPAAIKKRPLE